jgi:hypothetical protein
VPKTALDMRGFQAITYFKAAERLTPEELTLP